MTNNPALQRPQVHKATQRPNSGNAGNSGSGKGGRGNSGGSQKGGNTPPRPSPWLEHPLDPNPTPHRSAGFVEYLRWMRSPASPAKDGTKVELMTMAEQGDYRQRLQVLTERTRQIAGKNNCFAVTCPWRIRVGGHRGPESILLPAFDNLGIPYIPSSTLRGVARAQAIREVMQNEGVPWAEADKLVGQRYFGYLDSSDSSEKAGKIIFLDAYPLPEQKNGGLAVDMANNLWSWNNGNLKYAANPNVFFSLREASFLIGIKPTNHCSPQMLKQVKNWLIRGLTQGIGSQVNAGYGILVESLKQVERGFFSVDFTVQGQLIHGCQKCTSTSWQWNVRNQAWQMRGQPEAEVRATAFKSLLRYWFRAFARGVLPPAEVQSLEGMIFGAIQPQPKHGYLRVRVINGRVTQPEARPNQQGKNDPCGEEQGTLVLDYSSEVPDAHKETLKELASNLMWLMFHLGGIGQGARRPCYSRKTRNQAPWWRGSNLIPKNNNPFWKLPSSAKEFKEIFQQRLQRFYEALGQLSNHPINPTQPLSIGTVTTNQWAEAIDANCRIVVCSRGPRGEVCSGDSREEKPYGLALLHDPNLKVNGNYDKNLCGSTGKPSPVWVADLGNYQVITIFGVNKDPRLEFLKHLNKSGRCLQLFPFKSS
ncbi:RAMP superfamily CRISPR-associated protein [Thermosynechococcus sp. PP45]|uniref:RAMP superfamily CRISPR-associated protein n=1 Tax=unclassified Thermosynechococcus TaxID=2622553 RepID=UPI002673A704|nr:MULTISPECIES: RAMP superfamily CRISPR-associated protein [unclassified Thermosynechococcus]WKT81316.1 RAMP superfamily CRISPR-associated protein [Thermosynechococcus sp. PP45]WNC24928.1 RAMP superfamily CRISPR-associated protein [Thermosynechococcus sp. PP551]WNC27505.1 RAMP superfamily CRISPR-associated protein [Thermosynechococcus sp. PP555]